MKKKIKSANGAMVPEENVLATRKLYSQIINSIEEGEEENTTIIIDALVNSIMHYAFNYNIDLPILQNIISVLYEHWKINFKNNILN